MSALASPASTAGSSSARVSSAARVGRKRGTLDEADYLIGPTKSVHRRRADPRVSLSSVLLDVFNELKVIPGVEPLMQPVNASQALLFNLAA